MAKQVRHPHGGELEKTPPRGYEGVHFACKFLFAVSLHVPLGDVHDLFGVIATDEESDLFFIEDKLFSLDSGIYSIEH